MIARRRRGRAPGWCCAPRRSRPGFVVDDADLGEPEGGPSSHVPRRPGARSTASGSAGRARRSRPTPPADDQRPCEHVRARRPRRDACTATARSTRSPTAARSGTSAPAPSSSRSRSRACAVSLFVCYDLRFADEFWRLARRHRRLPRARQLAGQAAAPLAARCCRPGRSRTRRTSSASTGSARAAGSSYCGDSRIIDPLGEMLATAADTETILLADVSAAHVRQHPRPLPVPPRPPLTRVLSLSANQTRELGRSRQCQHGLANRDARILGSCSSAPRPRWCRRPMRSRVAPTRRCPSPRPTTSTAIRCEGPWPEGFQTAVFGLGCFWGAEKLFWQTPGVWTTAVGYAGGYTPNPTYEEVCSGRTGHTEAVLVVFDPAVVTFEQLLRRSGRSTTRPRACARATTSARSTAAPCTSTDESQRAVGRGDQGPLRRGAARRRVRRDHHRDRPARRLLLRRAVPPAVPRQEPGRLLPDHATGVSCRV